jgi:hypothetical protein
VFPREAGDGIGGDGAEGEACPQWLCRSCVLAQPAHAVVHRFGEFAQVTVQAGGARRWQSFSPGPERLGLHAVEQVPHPGVQDTGDVPRAG